MLCVILVLWNLVRTALFEISKNGSLKFSEPGYSPILRSSYGFENEVLMQSYLYVAH